MLYVAAQHRHVEVLRTPVELGGADVEAGWGYQRSTINPKASLENAPGVARSASLAALAALCPCRTSHTVFPAISKEVGSAWPIARCASSSALRLPRRALAASMRR